MDPRTAGVLALATVLAGCGGSHQPPRLSAPEYAAMLAAQDDYQRSTGTLARAQEQCPTEGAAPTCGDYLASAVRVDDGALRRWTAAFAATRLSARGDCREALGGMSMAVAAHSRAFTDYALRVSDRKPVAAEYDELTAWRERRLPAARQAFVRACAPAGR
jgi:hypothetical protein